jgi:translation initiation factor IF-1
VAVNSQESKKFIVDGIVEDCLPNTVFIVKIDAGGVEHKISAHLSGRMRMNYIKIAKGDKVRIEMSTYDLTKGRIIYRNK